MLVDQIAAFMASLPERPVTPGKSPAEIRQAPPVLGSDSDSVLAELGYTLEQIKGLREEGVI